MGGLVESVGGGRRRVCLLALVLGVSLACLVAGVVMLCVGAAAARRGGRDATPVPVFLRLRNRNVTDADLDADLAQAALRLRDLVRAALGQRPVLTVLSLTKSQSSLLSDSNAAKALVSVTYSTKYAPPTTKLKDWLGDKGFSVDKVYESDTVPTSQTDQICSSNNPDTDKSSTTVVSPTQPGDSTVSNTPAPTKPSTSPNPDEPYKPCDGGFVLALDTSKDIPTQAFKNQVSFVGNTLFGDNFSHFERLSLGFYDIHAAFLPAFGTVRNWADAHKATQSISQGKRQSLIRIILKELSETTIHDRLPDKSITFIVFVWKTTADQVEAALPYAQDILSRGHRLVLLSLSDDASPDQLKRLSANVFQWKAAESKAPADYQSLFEKAYGCSPKAEEHGLRAKRDTNVLKEPYPCDGNIVFALDSSKALQPNDFTAQKFFLVYQVFGQAWTNASRLAILNYDRYSYGDAFGYFRNFYDVQTHILDIQQSKYSPSLRLALKAFDDNAYCTSYTRSHAVVFVSTISAEVVDTVAPIVNDMQSRGCVLTFVGLGAGVSEDLLRQLGGDVILWDVQKQIAPEDWLNLFWKAYGCGKTPPGPTPVTTTRSPVPTTKVSPTVTQPAFTSTKDPSQYWPCKGQINILIDRSKNIGKAEFEAQKNFFVNQLFQEWNHFDRLVLGYYDSISLIESPGALFNLASVKEWFDELSLSSRPSNLRGLFKEIVDGTHTEMEHLQQSYIILVSAIDQRTVAEVQSFARTFWGRRVTFVAVAGADAALLGQIGYSVVEWRRGRSEPDDWRAAFWKAYGCDGPSPTNQPIVSTSATRTTPTTRTAATTTTAGPDQPFVPCKGEFVVMVDSSAALSQRQFQCQNDLVTDHLLSTFNHYDRLSIGNYDFLPSINAAGTFGSLQAVRAELRSIAQATGRFGRKANLRKLFNEIENNSQYHEGRLTYIIFTSALNADDLAELAQIYSRIRSQAKISLIGTNLQVSDQDLAQISTYSFKTDACSPGSDIGSKLSQAFQC